MLLLIAYYDVSVASLFARIPFRPVAEDFNAGSCVCVSYEYTLDVYESGWEQPANININITLYCTRQKTGDKNTDGLIAVEKTPSWRSTAVSGTTTSMAP